MKKSEKKYTGNKNSCGGEITTVYDWYNNSNLFANEAEARGGFKLAREQALDGMGTSTEGWMGYKMPMGAPTSGHSMDLPPKRRKYKFLGPTKVDLKEASQMLAKHGYTVTSKR